MNKRRTKDYVIFFREAKNHRLTLNPTKCMIDFELGAILAFKKCLHQIEAKGCLFHFGQSIMTDFLWNYRIISVLQMNQECSNKLKYKQLIFINN